MGFFLLTPGINLQPINATNNIPINAIAPPTGAKSNNANELGLNVSTLSPISLRYCADVEVLS